VIEIPHPLVDDLTLLVPRSGAGHSLTGLRRDRIASDYPSSSSAARARRSV
jgi:hypothetical protein